MPITRKQAEAVLLETDHKNAPPTDIDEFWHDLCVIEDKYLAACTFREKSEKNRSELTMKKKAVSKVKAAADEIIDYLSPSLRSFHLEVTAKSRDIDFDADSLIASLNFLKDSLPDVLVIHPNALSPESWLIGQVLPKVYKKHFGEDWSFSTHPSKPEPYGPGIRFSSSIIREIVNKKVNANSIVSAHKRYKD